MKLIEAQTRIEKIAHIPFKDYLSARQIEDAMMKTNKGKTGQLLELTIGLNLSNTTLDFEDGELKTNKCDHNGKPLETMFITQIASIIDSLLSKQKFQNTKLYEKFQRLLYVPISKDGTPAEWMYLSPIMVDLSLPKYGTLAKQLETDYYNICGQLNRQLSESSNATLHTASGEFIQIRTKDSKPYHPIFSNIYGRKISDKNRAFYFKKEFMKYIISLED
ncbi:MAG: MutH/Sau3AI family endonuclease [Lachnospiraceae bacterium]|nr:MutH/Sau3AI family endonuclease [Lachnospiraceae bacterium]